MRDKLKRMHIENFLKELYYKSGRTWNIWEENRVKYKNKTAGACYWERLIGDQNKF
jgi:hypothetical protein